MFKYCNDANAILGEGISNTGKANKLGSHELKGANIFLSCDCKDLRVTLNSIVNYRGYRMIAMAQLPNIQKPVFGSPDGGISFYDDPKVGELLRGIGTQLNLLPHTTQDGAHEILAATDIEVHFVKDFDHHYVLDLSRLMPPDPCSSEKGSHYYHFFRPEFVKKLPFPVSSEVDKFIVDEEKDIVIWTIKTAQKSLRASIQGYANNLLDTKSTHAAYQFASSHKEMCYQLHLQGINLRYMGLLLTDLDDIYVQSSGKITRQSTFEHCMDVLCIEMFARTLKSIAQKEMREVKCNKPHEDTKQIKEVVVKILNYQFDNPTRFEDTLKNKYFKNHYYDADVRDISDIRSSIKQKYLQVYEKMLEQYNKTESIGFKTPDINVMNKSRMHEYKNEVISRLLVLANWKVNGETLKLFDKLHRKGTPFIFNIFHIQKISPSSKYLGYVDYANARFQLESLKKGAISKDRSERLNVIIDLLKSSLYKNYETPDVWTTLVETTIEYLRFDFDVHYIERIISSWVKNLEPSTSNPIEKNTPLFFQSFLLDKINRGTAEGFEILSTLSLREQDCLDWAFMNLEKLFLYCKEIDSNNVFRRSLSHFSKHMQGDIWKYFSFCTEEILITVPQDRKVITISELKEICFKLPDHLHLQLQGHLEEITEFVEHLLKNPKSKKITLKTVPIWAWRKGKEMANYPKSHSKEIEEAYKEWNRTSKKVHKLSNRMNSTSTLAPLGHAITFEIDPNGLEKFEQVNCATKTSTPRHVERYGLVVCPHRVMRYVILAKSYAILKKLGAKGELLSTLESLLQ
eukprot:TRINITY_DN2200_c0_g1_i5.p1 TRINITY_DN2200_c0_g1~~TRINITY_DN2200_c0_g1_i5.p1  ORF type:complete len:799 (+),score=195.39 TRINITY_DN2200_c0_g1_i5:1658-4054(+)